MLKEEFVFYSYLIISLVLTIFLSEMAYGYSTYGSPAEFGNLTDTTCFIGGDDGIVNCTGNAYFSSVYADVTGSSNSSDYWDSLNVPSDLNYKILLYYQNISNYRTHLSNFTDNLGHIEDNVSWNQSLATSLYADISVTDTTIGNCSSANSCSALIYSTNTSWKVNNASYADDCALLGGQAGTYYLDDTTIGNCSTQYSCTSVIYAGNTSWVTSLAYNTEAELTALLDDNYVEIDGTGGTITGNIEMSADLELEGGGLCIDPAGCAVEAGNFEIENGAFCIDKDGSLACNAGAGNISVMDGVIKVMSAGSYSCLNSGSDGDICAEYDIEAGDDMFADDFWDSGTNINTLYVQAASWTTIDDYPATCAAATPFVGTIGDTSTCRGVDSDTSPQLGGYLDANGQNIGSTSDEIENIYIGVNTKIYLGDGQEGEIYYDGSKLIIKV